MNSLEARVHGLELALDEISFDLAVSTGRVSRNGAEGAISCTNFLSSKLWRKAGARLSTSRLPSSGGESSLFVMNPLAKIPNSSLEVSSGGAVNNTTSP